MRCVRYWTCRTWFKSITRAIHSWDPTATPHFFCLLRLHGKFKSLPIIKSWRRREDCENVKAQDNPLPASLVSQSCRRNPSRPSSLAIFFAAFLQAFVRDANLASCVRNVFGGPFAKKAKSGARMSKRSSSRVALDSIT